MLANRAIGREDKSALSWMSSRWASAPGRLAGFFVGSAEARLETLPWVESADLEWMPDEGDWSAFSASGVGVLHRGADSVFGIQPNIERIKTGDRSHGSFGVFHRRALGGLGVGGVNLFADYVDDQRNGEFARWSMGADFRSPWADVFVNRYFGGDSSRTSDFGIRREVAYAPDGLDAEFRLHAPGREWIGGFARFSKWAGRFGQKDDANLAYGITFTPAYGPLAGLRAEMSTGDAAKFGIEYGRFLGVENFFAPASVPFSSDTAMSAPAVRENNIVIRSVEIAAAPRISPLLENPPLLEVRARQFVTDNSVPSYLRDAYDDCQWAGEPVDWYASAPDADLLAITGAGWAATITASASRDSNFQKLCQALRFHGDPNHRGSQNNTPLHTAAEAGALKNVKLLILAGADPALKNNDKKTPLDLASDFFDLIARGDGAEYCENASLSNAKGKFCEISRILSANGGECNISDGPLCDIGDGGYSALNHRNFAAPGRHIPSGGILTVTMRAEMQAYSKDDNYLNPDSPLYSGINTPAVVLMNMVDAATFSRKTGIALTTELGSAGQPYSGGVRIKYIFDKPPLIRVHEDGYVAPYTYREQAQNHGGRSPISGMGLITVPGTIQYSAVSGSGQTLSQLATIVVTVADPDISPPDDSLKFYEDYIGYVFASEANMRAGNVRFALHQAGGHLTLSVSGKTAAVRIPAVIGAGEYGATLRAYFSRDGVALNTATLAFTVTLVTVNISVSAEDNPWSAPQTPIFAPGYSGVLFSVTTATPVSDVFFAVSVQNLSASAAAVGGGGGVVRASDLPEGVHVGQVRATLQHARRNLATLTANFTITVAAAVSSTLYYYTPPGAREMLGTITIDARLTNFAIQAERPDLYHGITVNQSGQISLQAALSIGRTESLTVNITSSAMRGAMRVVIHVLGKCVVPENIESLRQGLGHSDRSRLGLNLYNTAGSSYTPPDDLCGYLRQGVDPNYAHSNQSPLIRAAFNNLTVKASILLDFGADPNLQYGATSKWTALYIAAGRGHYEVAKVIIDRGVKPNLRTWGEHKTPLHFLAAAASHTDIKTADFVQMLIANGAHAYARDSQGRTPLYTAIHYNNADVAEKLVAIGANPNTPETTYCRTPLHIVKNVGQVRILLRSTITLDVNKTLKHNKSTTSSSYKNGSTPLDTARNTAIAQLLRDNGGCYQMTSGAVPQCTGTNVLYQTCLD